MTTTALVRGPSPATTVPADDRRATRTHRDDVGAMPTTLRSEWIKLSSVRANRTILALTVAVDLFASWAVANLVTDEVLTVAEVFVYPAILTSVFAAVAGIMVFTSEAQHGTLAGTLTAQPARWVIAASKTVTMTTFGLVLGAAGMAAGFAGATIGGIELGDTSAMATTAMAALLYTSLAGIIGLGVGMTVRHSTGAISGVLVWWFVAENLLRVFTPAKLARFLPFDAGYRMLDIGSDLDSPEMIAVAFTRGQYGLIFAGYAVAALTIGTMLLHRRDAS